MIPMFPNFKSLEFAHKSFVDTFTSKLPPYSDFNFGSMWLWNHENNFLVSTLHNNLIVRLTEARSKEPYYSFLGTNKINETAACLFDYLSIHGLPNELKLVPEASANELSREFFTTEPDRDNFDYIYCTKELATMDGSKFVESRRAIRSFEKSTSQFHTIDLTDTSNLKKINHCVDSWVIGRNGHSNDNGCVDAELYALRKLLESSELLPHLTCFGLFVEGVLVGFFVGEILNDHFLLHFGKTNYQFKGTTAALFQRTARHLLEHGVKFINDEEDLGLPGLRFSKSRFRPVNFLKKYSVKSRK